MMSAARMARRKSSSLTVLDSSCCCCGGGGGGRVDCGCCGCCSCCCGGGGAAAVVLRAPGRRLRLEVGASREVCWVLGLLPPRQLRLVMQLLLDELAERAWCAQGVA